MTKTKKSKSAKNKPAKPGAKRLPATKPKSAGGKIGSMGDKRQVKLVVAKKPEAPKAPPAAAPSSANGGLKKPPPKGITIVAPKPLKKPKPKKLEMPANEPLIKPGMKWKPLIPSGPKAPPSSGIPGVGIQNEEMKIDPKARLNRKELERYREILLLKRAELLGDITNMEDEALRQNSGSLSNLPQHMAEQGSENFDQQLSLELAEVDRNLIREIDAALKRIDDGTFGVCERTGQRISAERLAELPWTKYSIEAAREMERRPYSE